ncbi:MAG: conjugal transfer protein [Acidimicrobiia bacterium]|nr:conjugal transfer protein [Acidimicrobiia bacterium]
MTAEGRREVVVSRPSTRRGWNPVLTVRALHIVLWLLVISGPVTALLVATQLSSLSDRLDLVDIEAGVEMPPDTAGVEGFAELFIATYLGAGEGSTDSFGPFLDNVSLDGVESGSWSATRTTSLGASEVAPGYYAVTVAAEVVAAESDSDGQPTWIPAGTRFYSVGVAETVTGWAIAGLPALVPAPAGATAPDLLIDRLDGLDAAPGLEQMLSRFLAAYLAGDGELTRYTSPSSPIVPVQPSPFSSVEIQKAGIAETSDGPTEVAVVVRATDIVGRAQILEYALVVEQRDGRWEVSELLPAPPLVMTTGGE